MIIHLETISRIVKIEREKVDLQKGKEELEKEKEELMKEKEELEKEKEELKMEKEELKRENEELKKEKERPTKVEDGHWFSVKKAPMILLSGDSHLKSISLERLASATGKSIEIVKTFCCRDNWPGALKPQVSISSVLLKHVHSRATHLLLTAPTSDLTNLTRFSQSERTGWIDLSAKTIISTAEMCLTRFPALRGVTILEHMPRYFLVSRLMKLQNHPKFLF